MSSKMTTTRKPTETEVEEYRQWLIKYFESKTPTGFTDAEQDAVELDRR